MIAVDTSVLIELEAGNGKVIGELMELRKAHPENPAIPFICFSEFYYGLLKGRKNVQAGLEFLNKFTPLHSTNRSMKLISEIKLDLEKRGKAIQLFDMVIASVAIDYNVTLATCDTGFENVRGLKVALIKAK